MSLHSSLKLDAAGAQQRSVLSRIERIKDLMKKGLWAQQVTALPKTKVLKVKAKKKAAKKEEGTAEGAAATTAAGAPSAAPAAKAAAAPAKAAAPAAKKA